MKKYLVPTLVGLWVFIIQGTASTESLSFIKLVTLEPIRPIAGQTIKINVTLENTGTELWQKNKYNILVNIYDNQKQYLTHTEKIWGEIDVPEKGTGTVAVPFTLPNNYKGEYYYKVKVNIRDITESDFYYFYVADSKLESQEKELKPEEKVEYQPVESLPTEKSQTEKGLGFNYDGQLTFSAQNTSVYKTLANFGTNLNAYTSDNRFSLSSNTEYDELRKETRIRNLLFEWYWSEHTHLGIGDVYPNFSEFTLSGMIPRGFLTDFNLDKIRVSGIAARTIEPIEGGETSSGVYAQYLYGGKVEYDFLPGNTLGVQYINIADNGSSIKNPGTTLLQKNYVASIIGKTQFEEFSLDGEYALSNFDKDDSDGADGLNDKAFKINAQFRQQVFGVGARYKRVNTNFNSLGTSITPDRAGYAIFTDYTQQQIFFVSANHSRENDNLNTSNNVPTTVYMTNGININTLFPEIPSLTFGWSINNANSNEVLGIKTDYNVNSFLSGLSYSFLSHSLSVSYQLSRFRDNTGRSNDADTNTISGNGHFSFGDISFSTGYTTSKTKNLAVGSETKFDNIDGNVGYFLIPQIMELSSGVGLNLTKDTTGTTDNNTLSFNEKISYKIISSLDFLVRFTLNDYKNKIIDSSSYTEKSINVGLTYIFSGGF